MSALQESWIETRGKAQGREFVLVASVHDEEMRIVLMERVGGLLQISKVGAGALFGYGDSFKRLMKKLKKVKNLKVML